MCGHNSRSDPVIHTRESKKRRGNDATDEEQTEMDCRGA